MRLIHTADWHLCDRLGRHRPHRRPRAGASSASPSCARNMPADVLLIAGDLFSEQATVDEMTDALDHIRTDVHAVLRPRRDDPGHHRQPRPGRSINMVRAGMTLAAPDDRGKGGLLAGAACTCSTARRSRRCAARTASGCSSCSSLSVPRAATTCRRPVTAPARKRTACCTRQSPTGCTVPRRGQGSTRPCRRCWSPTCTSAAPRCTACTR